MEIAVELHSLWNLPSAIRIAEALEEIKPLWYEDPICMDNPDALAAFARSTRVPTTASETLTSTFAFRQLLERDAVGIVMFDPVWVGGITEARKVCRARRRLPSPGRAARLHRPGRLRGRDPPLPGTPNAMIQEGVRAFYHGWYEDVLTELPSIVDGYVAAPAGPGLGTALQPGFTERPDMLVRATTADGTGLPVTR